MSIAPEHQIDFQAMPDALQRLLKAELKAGNEIVEVGHSFPAPPAGAYFKLAKPVSTRARKSTPAVSFYDRNTSIYSGEFTDAKRFYFILEPPHPPPPEPDMNAIRAGIEAKQREVDAKLYKAQRTTKTQRKEETTSHQPSVVPPRPTPTPKPPSLVDRFRESMTMNYERWHDGIGYDLSLIKNATPEELMEIENLLVSRSVDDWRDVEALAALDSRRARALLRKALKRGESSIRTAVTSYAPHLVSEDERTDALVAALENSKIYEGLTQALLEVEGFHPPEAIEALIRGLRKRDGETAVHFAAMLMVIHGKAKTSFDWDQRPFFLRFNADDGAERRAAFCELCEKIGVDPEPYLKKLR